MQKINSKEIQKVFTLATKLKNPINLSIGQPDFDIPREIKQAAINAIQNNFNQYTSTQGILELRQEIANKLKSQNSIEADYNTEILVTSAVSGGLFLTLQVLVNPQDEIIIHDPYFVMYKHLINLCEGKPVFWDTYPDFRPKISKLKKLITTKTKAIILNSPCNPTGIVFTKKEVKEIIKIAKENNLFIISDEIYEDFVFDISKNFSPGSIYKKTITLNGFSKSHAMTGWRIGYASGPKKTITAMKELQQYIFVCASSFAQKAAINVLKQKTNNFIIKQYQQKRDFIYDKLKDYYNIQKPDGAFYIFPEAPDKNGIEFANKAIKNNLIIIPSSVFSEKKTHFRISFATSNQTIERGIYILKKLAS